MFNRLKAHLYSFDWIIMAAVLLLISFGLVEIYSVALGRESLDLLNFRKQILFAVLGFVLLFTFSFVDYYLLKSISRYLFFFGILILIFVLIFGETIRGTKGWFNIAGFSLQPVEFIKIILILFLAHYFSGLATKVKTIKHFLASTAYTLVFVGLVLLQPDFGSALILSAIWMVIIMAADFNLKYFIAILLATVILFTSAWFFFFKDYQKERIMTFVNPTSDSLESGYNSSQAIIAIGSG
ncbi:MAG: FtsW/RodA/SpoVE family cell cycle protein, partial [Patescibacteria group bacterium]